MNTNKKAFIFFLLLLILGLGFSYFMPREEKNENTSIGLRIGSGDDITGLLLKQILKTNKDIEIDKIDIADENEGILYDFTFKDCWSNTAQWALSSEEIDMAFYCNHMALHLVRTNNNFEIYGPAIMNAEVIAYKGDINNVCKLGIGQKREHLYTLAKESHKQVREIVEISPISLPYSLEAGQIDGAVLDISKASLLPGFTFTPLSKDDYISYSLVVRKDIVDTKAFKNFLITYNKTIEELNQIENFKKYTRVPENFDNDIKIKFLSLE